MDDPRTNDLMQALARGTDSILNSDKRPKENAFVILVAPFDGPEGARTNYVSNAKREDILVMLKEVVARFEGQPEISGRA